MLFRSTRRRVETVDPTEGTFTVVGDATKPHNPLDHLTGFVLENLPSLLDEPGEWFLGRDGRLTYLPRAGETPGTTRATYPVVEKLLIFRGETDRPVAHLAFRDLKFRHAKGVDTLAAFEPNQAAVARVDGVPVFRGVYGASRGKAALKVVETVRHNELNPLTISLGALK